MAIDNPMQNFLDMVKRFEYMAKHVKNLDDIAKLNAFMQETRQYHDRLSLHQTETIKTLEGVTDAINDAIVEKCRLYGGLKILGNY